MLLNKYYIFDGAPADQLYGTSKLLSENDGKFLLKDLRQDPDQLIQILDKFSGNGQWYYELIRENIDSVNIPVINYYDFIWWVNFNTIWAGLMLNPHHMREESTPINLFFNNYVSWYNTVEYQLWSMSTHLNEKYLSNIAFRKLASKNYIYEFDCNKYYYYFKCKSTSVGQSYFRNQHWFCLTDDNRRLYLDQDLEEILTLLPEHINH
jgi:hypothetical protein